jgi:hypothetical protein
LTSGNAAAEPVFDPKGRYLYFLSNRDFNLTFSGYEFNHHADSARAMSGCWRRTGLACSCAQHENRAANRQRCAALARRPKPAIPPAAPVRRRDTKRCRPQPSARTARACADG